MTFEKFEELADKYPLMSENGEIYTAHIERYKQEPPEIQLLAGLHVPAIDRLLGPIYTTLPEVDEDGVSFHWPEDASGHTGTYSFIRQTDDPSVWEQVEVS